MGECLEEIDNSLSSFLSNIKRVKDSRNHKVKNSYGVYDGFKYYRKNRPKDSMYVLNESQYFTIIRQVNELLANELIEGKDVTLPSRLGRLEIRKYETNVSFKNGKLVTNLPIDWDRTLKLWYEDKEAMSNKTLIRKEEKEVYKVYYNKNKAEYNNKSFYQFNVNRELKKRLKQSIKEGKVEAFLFK